MKTYSLKNSFILLLILFANTLYGQKHLSKKPINQKEHSIKSKQINRKTSAVTAMFLNEGNHNSKISKIDKNGENYVNTILLLNNGCSIEDINDLPILINTGNKGLITALIPINLFETISKNDCIKYLDIGVPFKNTLDEARDLTNVDIVHQGLGLNSSYDGSGVIVGVIDGGFDFTHPTFRNELGDLRISRVWIQGDTSGTEPSGYNYGSEYIGGPSILAKQRDTDDGSHGTHVAGIAAGNGTDGGSNTYKGIANNSEVVLVSYILPFNDVISNTNVKIIDALNYLVNYAKSVNKPLVINMSLGTHYGAHDGTSLLDQEIDSLVEEGIIIVGAAGNEGGKKIHVSSNFTAEETKYYFVENNQNKGTTIDIWGDINTNFEISFSIYNRTSDVWIDVLPNFFNTNSNLSGQAVLNDNIDGDKWTINYGVASTELNQKPRAIVVISYLEDLILNDGDIFVLEIKAQNTTVHAWCNSEGESSKFENYGYSNVVDGDDNITIGEIGGTANNIIIVGAYTSKNNYNDFSWK